MFITTFLWSQLFVTPPVPSKDFAGKTVIVTGSNTGLGLEAARHITRLNCAKVILAVRTVSKGQKAKESILASTGRKDDCVEVWELDMCSNDSITAFAKRVQSLDRLDAVIENAGLMTTSFKLVEGNEEIIQVNVVGTFLLALLLLPKLRMTARTYNVETNLEIVSSEAHHRSSVTEADSPDLYAALNDDRAFDWGPRYNTSKSMEILFVRELVKHSGDTPIITTVNPGLCHSEFFRYLPTNPLLNRFIIVPVKAILARTSEVGSRTLVAGITAGKGSHGQYMSDSKNQEVASWVTTPRGIEVQKKVYDQTLDKLEKISPGIRGNIAS